jgi:hypothetical protein
LRLASALILCAIVGGCATNDAGYFTTSELREDDGYLRRWFSRHFLTMNEPVLYRQINVDYSIRLTRFTDEVDAFSLRIDRLVSGDILSSYKRFTYVRAGELNPRPAAVIAHRLAPAELSLLISEIEDQNFFALGETEFVEGNIVWLLEVFDGANFHAVVRATAQRGQPFGAIAATAAEIARLGNITGS